ncbi:MAG: AAA family ATPase [Snowella sp.]|nr:AAA family ATPase [Snowella sp.]
MRIEQLEIKNFRCLEDITIKFPVNNLAVIIGVNGAGKSSLLDVIAKSLNSIVIKISQIDKSLNKNKTSRMTGFSSNIDFDDIQTSYYSCLINSRFKTKSESFEVSLIKDINSEKKRINQLSLDNFISNLFNKTEDMPWTSYPCFSYYKAYQKSKLATKLGNKTIPRITQMLSYYSCFSIAINDFSDFKAWYEFEENIENERRVRENDSYRNQNIVLVKKSIEEFFEHLFISDFSNLRIERIEIRPDTYFTKLSQNSIKSEIFIDKKNQSFKLEKLSDGEKRLLMLVTDLARRLAIANPGLGEDALKGAGIVLIDEIDLHLHPQWQRRVLPALTKTFPNCQFIVTTHSPQVLSEVPRESVFILENGKLLEYSPHTLGRDSNSILSEIFNVKERPEWSQRKIDHCLDLIDDEKWDEAKESLKELSNLLGENDTAVVRAESVFHFMEN